MFPFSSNRIHLVNIFFKPSLMHKTIGLIPSTGKKEWVGKKQGGSNREMQSFKKYPASGRNIPSILNHKNKWMLGPGTKRW